MSDGVSLTPQSAARTARAVRALEAGRAPGGEASARLSEPLLVARCTGAISGGVYPATITAWDEESAAWVDFATCKLKSPNGETLVSGTRYGCVPVAFLAAGELLLLVVGGPGGACTVTFVTNICEIP